MSCEKKRTAYQPTDDEWECPNCGTSNGFSIDESDCELDCNYLHKKDLIGCSRCGFGTTGSRLASAIAKRKNMVQCPCCKGKGVVKGEAK